MMAGNQFRTVYDVWVGDVVRWVRALGAPPADREDLVQNVFVVVHLRLDDFRGNNMGGWLYRIAARQVRDHRRLRWVCRVLRRGVPLSPDLPASGPTPLVALESKEEHLTLARLLSSLNSDHRTTFVLFELDGYRADEIARMQNVSISTVRSR